MAETPSPYDPLAEPPEVKNHVRRPPGILPRNAQTWLVVGIALVMMIIIAFSGRTPTPKPAETPTPTTNSVVDPVQARIQEYRARIDEQVRRLAAEQAQVAQAKQALGVPSLTGTAPPYTALPTAPPSVLDDPAASAVARQRAEIAAARAKRQYESAFASNIVSSRRSPDALAATPGTPAGEPPDALRFDEGSLAMSPKASAPKTHRILEGTVIETVLTNRLDGTYSGPVNCLVTTNVYSHDRQALLIPQGSRVLGDVKPVDSFGQRRLALAFHRLILPNGNSTTLEQMPGLNQLGETGLVDKVNQHYLQIFGVSLAIGAIAGLNQATTRYGSDAAAVDAYRQGMTSSVSQSSLNILDRFLNILPTVTIREGHRIKVYLTGDLSLPAYDRDAQPRDL